MDGRVVEQQQHPRRVSNSGLNEAHQPQQRAVRLSATAKGCGRDTCSQAGRLQSLVVLLLVQHGVLLVYARGSSHEC
eukprot:4617915-Amphidinium_carterae.1